MKDSRGPDFDPKSTFEQVIEKEWLIFFERSGTVPYQLSS
jgi:hypothetical protein